MNHFLDSLIAQPTPVQDKPDIRTVAHQERCRSRTFQRISKQAEQKHDSNERQAAGAHQKPTDAGKELSFHRVITVAVSRFFKSFRLWRLVF